MQKDELLLMECAIPRRGAAWTKKKAEFGSTEPRPEISGLEINNGHDRHRRRRRRRRRRIHDDRRRRRRRAHALRGAWQR